MKKELIVLIITGLLLGFTAGIIHTATGFSEFNTPELHNIHHNNPVSKYTISNISELEPGDILFQISQYVVQHCLLYKGYNTSTNTYEFIEAHSAHNVRYRSLSENSVNYLVYNKFVRVKTANATQKQNAILFAETQIGKEFELDMILHDKNHNPNDPNDPYATTWYCTELMWAAYYNCNHTPDKKIYGEGIDIDRNEWEKDSLIYSMVWPEDILKDDDIELYRFSKHKHHDTEIHPLRTIILNIFYSTLKTKWIPVILKN